MLESKGEPSVSVDVSLLGGASGSKSGGGSAGKSGAMGKEVGRGGEGSDACWKTGACVTFMGGLTGIVGKGC